MSKAGAGEIPFEPQQATGTCGAAALCMVYRSFGLACTQSEIWERIARPGLCHALRTNTRQLAADALGRGLAALILKAKDPWRALELSVSRGIRVILNQRSTASSQTGHYSLLVGLDDKNVVLHDPYSGPFRQLTRHEFLALWRSTFGPSEVTGQVLVAFDNMQASGLTCALCGCKARESVACFNCKHTLALHPGAILGCESASCPSRTWACLFCPQCDAAMFDLAVTEAKNQWLSSIPANR
jgi:hypothetical protein